MDRRLTLLIALALAGTGAAVAPPAGADHPTPNACTNDHDMGALEVGLIGPIAEAQNVWRDQASAAGQAYHAIVTGPATLAVFRGIVTPFGVSCAQLDSASTTGPAVLSVTMTIDDTAYIRISTTEDLPVLYALQRA